jgi:hypothetical protein
MVNTVHSQGTCLLLVLHRLFSAVVDSAAIVSPAVDALSPLGSLRPAAAAAAVSQMHRWSTGDDDVGQLTGGKAAELGALANAAGLVLHVPAAAGHRHVGQVLTIVPTAYQPRRSSRQTTEDMVGDCSGGAFLACNACSSLLSSSTSTLGQ